jgi:hypothetical protein
MYERVLRYVVEYMDTITDPRMRAEFVINGLDPDDNWLLMYSFHDDEDAQHCMEEEKTFYAEFCEKHGYTPRKQFRVRDLGQEETLIESSFF